MSEIRDFLRETARVKPSDRQLNWYAMGTYAFVHFSPNTYTDREWGLGDEDEAIFNPAKLDCDQWVRAIKSTGMKGMVLTAKHHDGFCLWPSRYTEHSVKNSPYPYDIVKEASDACRRGGIKFGVYLSPWDRNNPLYGTPAYNDYFCDQLTELLTQYGDIFYVWFDNACGEGPNGRKQEYDFPRYISLIRKYQPGAVIFNDHGPDIRWCGNEAGAARHSEWAVVPKELCGYSEVQTGPGPLVDEGDLHYMFNTDQEIGTLPVILHSEGLTFTPAEINMSIRPGWFWHEKEEPHSLERLFKTYLTSYGGNACMHLNIPPNRDGLFDERDIRRLQAFGDLIRREFGAPIAASVEKDPDARPMQPKYVIRFAEPVDGRKLHYVVIRENIRNGQRVEGFKVMADFGSGAQFPICQGTCIGYRKICVLQDPFAQQNPEIDDRRIPQFRQLTLHITASRDVPEIEEIQVY